MGKSIHKKGFFSKTATLFVTFTVAAVVFSSGLAVFIRNEVCKRDLRDDIHRIGVSIAVILSDARTHAPPDIPDLPDIPDMGAPSGGPGFISELCDSAASIFRLRYAGAFMYRPDVGYECVTDCEHSSFASLYPEMPGILTEMYSTDSSEARYDTLSDGTLVCFTPLSSGGKNEIVVCTAANMGEKSFEIFYIAAMTAGLAIVLLVTCQLIALSVISKRETNRIHTVISEIRSSTAEKVRIGTDLNVATKIQADMLPTQFPASGSIELYAAMTPAKEVGGDFYDFFNIDRDHIAMVMADVSGKGVPAALFMVIAKTLIQDRALMGRSPARVLEYANNRLCENNDSGMFVTAWVGVLELSTGKLTYSSAGHEYPVFRRAGGSYEMLTEDNAPPLAAIEDIEYEDTKTMLEPGDSLFLYTDGVPEAKSPAGKRFGTDKMIEVLNKDPDSSAEDVIKRLRSAIDEFDAGSDPFDDVTMMCLRYFGKK